MKTQGGFLSLDDLAAHRSEWVEPMSTNYRGYDVWELPPNGQGIAALQMLNILEGYDFSKIPFGSARHAHLFTEAKKLVFEDRAKFYADPEFAQVPVKWLLSKEYAAQRRALISDIRAARRLEAGHPPLKEGDTIYLTVADRDGNMVSLIDPTIRNGEYPSAKRRRDDDVNPKLMNLEKANEVLKECGVAMATTINDPQTVNNTIYRLKQQGKRDLANKLEDAFMFIRRNVSGGVAKYKTEAPPASVEDTNTLEWAGKILKKHHIPADDVLEHPKEVAKFIEDLKSTISGAHFAAELEVAVDRSGNGRSGCGHRRPTGRRR